MLATRRKKPLMCGAAIWLMLILGNAEQKVPNKKNICVLGKGDSNVE